MYRSDDGPNFRTFAEALKAGNPDSLVSFNPGVVDPVISHTPYEDYTAGECNGLPTNWAGNNHNKGRYIDGAQYHVFTYLGEFWCNPNLRFPDELVAGYTKYVNSQGGVMTWDVYISPDGTIPDVCRRQLSAVKRLIG
jgi:hypothetical protein